MTSNNISISNRRDFIKTSAIATSGLVISFKIANKEKDASGNRLDAADEAVAFNSYLSVLPDGTAIIYSPNPETGQGIKTAFPMIVAEELDMDWNKIKVVQAPLDTKKFERQVAGGSRSIPHSWKRLREAGATVRYLLLQAAAKAWSIPVEELTTSNGKIYHRATNKSDHYGSFVEAAKAIELPKEVKLKHPSQFHTIGKFVKAVDNHEVFTGKAIFGLDYNRPGMVQAMIVRPPAFGQRLKSVVNADAIKSMPGITDVVTMSNNKVAIVGKTTFEIIKAKRAINIEWESPKPLESSDDHDRILTEMINTGKMDVKRSDGDIESAFKSAHKIIESEFQCPFIPHNAMEPMNFFADVKSDRADLAGPSQAPEGARNAIAKMLNMPQENVTIELTKLGGGFGRRLNSDYALEAAELSSLIKKPVKVTWSREDDMTAGIYRPACKYKFKAGIDDKGNMIAFQLRAAGMNSGNPSRENNFPVGAVPNVSIEAADYKSDVTTGPWRAPITNFLAGAEQIFFDEVAEAGGKDPIALRLDWIKASKANPVGKVVYEPDRFKSVIDLVAEKSGWNNKKKKGIYRGFSTYFAHSTYVAMVAEVSKVKGQPQLNKVYVAVDCGILVNQSGAKNQIVGSVVDGLGHAMYARLTFKDGMPEQNNFDSYRLIRLNEIPEVEVHFVKNEIEPTGLGEPAIPVVSGAVSNAYYQATGVRMKNQPFIDYIDGVIKNGSGKKETMG